MIEPFQARDDDMKKWLLIAFTLVISVALAGAYSLGFFAPSFQSVAQKPIERVELMDLGGDAHSFDELERGETVLYLFASWCAPCFKTLETLQQLSEQNKYAVRLLAVALDEDIAGIDGMLDTSGFTGEVWLAKEGTSALQKRYFDNERRAIPYVVKLDADTNVLESGYS